MGDMADMHLDCMYMEDDLYCYNYRCLGYERKPSGPGNCPLCGKETILKDGKYGKFYGCSDFPNCKGTRKWEREYPENKEKLIKVTVEIQTAENMCGSLCPWLFFKDNEFVCALFKKKLTKKDKDFYRPVRCINCKKAGE